MAPLKCIGIGCSPRVKGNTALLLEKALEGAVEQGAEVESIYLRNLKFSPCMACDGCQESGQCVVKDDMQLVYEKMLTADRIILAAPIFSMGINALGKALIDRGQRFWVTKYVLHQPVAPRTNGPERKGIFISAAGTNLPGVFDCAIRSIKYFYKMLDVTYLNQYCYRKIDAKGDILQHPTALNEVYQAGRQLATD